MCQLLRRAHPWPHRDSVGPGIVGGPRRGVAAPVVVVGATGAVVLAFRFPFTIVFTAIVGGWARGGGAAGGHVDSC
jgi:hypothetical protein